MLCIRPKLRRSDFNANAELAQDELQACDACRHAGRGGHWMALDKRRGRGRAGERKA